jgi:hypothetical protein
MAEAPKGEAKKPYSPPVLTVHGTVRELTQTVQPGVNLDGGSGGFMSRTGSPG